MQHIGPMPFHIKYYGLILALSGFIYPMLSLIQLFRHRNHIENEFSNIEKINLNWLRYWIIISITGFWISFIIIWVAQYEWVNYLTSFQVVATQLTFNIVIIGFYGVRQTTIFTNMPSLVVEDRAISRSKSVESKAPISEASDLLLKVQKFMLEEKPFLDSQLTIDMLASQLHMSRHELSQIINEQVGLNFFNFVNQYRVEEIKKRIANKQYTHLTLLGIALETGFNSKSSFNHIFKKNEGVTPSEYKRKIAESN